MLRREVLKRVVIVTGVVEATESAAAAAVVVAVAAAAVVVVGGVQGEVEVEEGGDLLEAGVVVEVAGDLSVEVEEEEEEEAGNLWAEEEEEEAGNQLGTDGAGGAADHPSNLSFVPVERANKPDIT